MPMLSKATPASPVPSPADEQLLRLENVHDAASVRALRQKRSDLRQRLKQLAEDIHQARMAHAQHQHASAYDIATKGNAWIPPASWKTSKAKIEDLEAQEEAISGSIPLITQEIEQEEKRVSRAVARACDRALEPHLTEVVRLLGELEGPARAIAGLLGKQRRFGSPHRQHLQLGNVSGQKKMFEHSLDLLKRGLSEEGEDVD